MALPNPISAADVPHVATSTAAVATVFYMPVVCPGRIKDFHISHDAALGTADETYTLAYAPPGSATYTNVTGGTVLIATSGAAAGDRARAAIAPSTSAYVQDGGSLRITPSGGGSAAVPVRAVVMIGP
jgi:hypothetical protein